MASESTPETQDGVDSNPTLILDATVPKTQPAENVLTTPETNPEEPKKTMEDDKGTQAKSLTSNSPESNTPANDEKASPESTPTPIPSLPQPHLSLLQVPQTPQTYLTFLFLTGRRRLMNFDPDTTIGRVKELVWGAWGIPTTAVLNVESGGSASTPTGQLNQDHQTQIEERPPAPSYLRVLYLGRMLQDDETLRDLKLPTHIPISSPITSPATPGGSLIHGGHGHGQHAPVSTIMHLSIRPFPSPGETDSGKKMGLNFGRSTDRSAPEPGEANTGCCGCVIC